MATPSERKKGVQTLDDPGESNDPNKSERDGYQAHIWTSLNQIFERLGKMDQKIDQLSSDHGKLKEAVEKHDKIVMRVVYTFGGIALVLVALWFLYENVLKGHITFTGNSV